MTGSVPVLSIIFMAVSALASFGIAVGLLFYFRKKGAHIVPYFIGWAVFITFALVLESLMHQLVLQALPVGKVILGNTWLYALYGGLAAGIFEETGRFIAFRTVMKRWCDKDVNALMYGAGHGACEAVMVLGLTMVVNIVFSLLINAGRTDLIMATAQGEANIAAAESTLEALRSSAPHTFLIGIVERIFAIAVHIGLSVIVWFGAKNSKKWFLFPLAIILHFLLDGIMVVVARTGISTLVIEAVVAVCAAAICGVAVLVWKRNHNKNSDPAENPTKEQAI